MLFNHMQRCGGKWAFQDSLEEFGKFVDFGGNEEAFNVSTLRVGLTRPGCRKKQLYPLKSCLTVL